MVNSFLKICALPILFAFGACGGGLMLLEKNQQLDNHKESIKKIVSLSPEFSKYKIGREELTISHSEKFGKRLSHNIKKIGKKTGLEIVIFDDHELSAGDVDYFNDIIRLKNAIRSAISLQSVVESKQKGKFFKRRFSTIAKPKVVVWEEAPVISSEFSYMAEKYGTPYFSVQGVIALKYPNSLAISWLIPPLGLLSEMQNRHATYYYNIVVNVETTEVIYREFRIMYNNARQSNIDPIIYDSFKMLRK